MVYFLFWVTVCFEKVAKDSIFSKNFFSKIFFYGTKTKTTFAIKYVYFQAMSYELITKKIFFKNITRKSCHLRSKKNVYFWSFSLASTTYRIIMKLSSWSGRSTTRTLLPLTVAVQVAGQYHNDHQTRNMAHPSRIQQCHILQERILESVKATKMIMLVLHS